MMPASSPPRRRPAVTADVAQDAVLNRRNDLIALSHDIHAEPELAFAEHRSAAKTQALVAERGFAITPAPAGLDTAFRADYGSGDLVVAVCAEYDALPGIGHACGHNIIAAAAVGAALALAEVADELGLTVVLMGTPAEESGGGKALLLKAGAFDDIAAAVMVHPGPADIAAARSLALSEVTVEYRGHESHASVAPYLGVNAGDAVTVAQVAIGLLRQQLAPGQQVHGIVTEGGRAANVIPGRAVLRYAMRAVEKQALRALEGEWSTASGPVGRPPAANAASTKAGPPTTSWPGPMAGERVPRRDEPPRPHPRDRELETALPLGSTDMGNVTQRCRASIRSSRRGGRCVPASARSSPRRRRPSADNAVIDGSIMLARTVVRLAETPSERSG